MKTIAIQADSLEQLHPQSDTTLAIAEEALNRNYRVWWYTPEDLCLDQGKLFAYMAPLLSLNLQDSPFYELGEKQFLSFDAIDVILIRQDPPFDMRYITATYLLEYAPNHTLCVNDPKAIRNCPEKLFVQSFPDFMPATSICSTLQHIEQFMEQYPDIVIKPLYGFGGNDVHRITADNRSTIPQVMAQLFERYQAPIIAQQYIDNIATTGDKRVLFIDGQVEGYFTRIPPQGEFISNLVQGGAAHETTLTSKEQKMCSIIGKSLKEQGLHLVGIDIIDEMVTEINVTSPTGFRPVEQLQKKNLSQIFWDKLSI